MAKREVKGLRVGQTYSSRVELLLARSLLQLPLHDPGHRLVNHLTYSLSGLGTEAVVA